MNDTAVTDPLAPLSAGEIETALDVPSPNSRCSH